MAASRDGINWFLTQAGRIPLLTNEEEIILGRLVYTMQTLLTDNPNGPYSKEERLTLRRGKRAKDRMINANLRLVVDVAKKYTHIAQHLDISDLIQEGMFGLIRGVEKFDPERGYKFSTYAYWWIRQGMTRAISQTDRSIRLPGNAIECLNKLRQYVPAFKREHGRAPTTQECADHCGIRKHNLEHYLNHSLRPRSLNSPMRFNGGSDEVELINAIQCSIPDAMEGVEVENGISSLDGWMSKLTERERSIIAMRYGLDGSGSKALSTIGKDLGVTKEAVRLTERKALNRLRFQAGLTSQLELRIA